MGFIGKLIGAMAGYALLRHPIGILLGVIIGHMWDSGVLRMHGFVPAAPRSFIDPLFALAGAIAKSDGRVSEHEIAATEHLMTRLQLSPQQRHMAIERFNAGKQPQFSAHLAIADLKLWCAGRRDLAYLLLDMLLDIAYAEGPLAAAKLGIVRKLCWALGVHERELAALAAMKGYAYAGPGASQDQAGERPRAQSAGKDPYAVLGISANASEREIKRAYRKLISQHHPDKLGDVPEELKRRAGERAREINAAYEKIQSERGLR